MRIGIVLRLTAGAAGPDEFAGLLIERVEAIRRRALRAPVRRDAARDDEVAVNQRRRRAAVREREPAKLFHHGMLPEQFPIGRERGENSLRALHEDIACLRINRRTRRGITLINRVANEIIVALAPELFARLRVEAADAFLQICALAEVAEYIEFAVRNDGRGLAGIIRDPQRVRRDDAVGQTGLTRDAALLRPAPREPAGDGRGGRRNQRREIYRKGEQQGATIGFHVLKRSPRTGAGLAEIILHAPGDCKG